MFAHKIGAIVVRAETDQIASVVFQAFNAMADTRHGNKEAPDSPADNKTNHQ